ncbi:MAG: flagellar brake protein [Pseudomonadota bacterium]
MVDPELFQPEVPLVITFQTMAKVKLTSFFRGYKAKEYLVIDLPNRDGRPAPVLENTPCIARFIHEGDIIGFRSKVVAVLSSPTPLVFLKFPTAVESSRLRKADRYPVNIEATCSTAPQDGRRGGSPRATVLNLSEGGCLVQSPGPFDLGSNVFLSVVIPEQGRVDNLETEVKRCQQDGEAYLLGLAFADLLDPSYQEIRKFLNLLETYHVRA